MKSPLWFLSLLGGLTLIFSGVIACGGDAASEDGDDIAAGGLDPYTEGSANPQPPVSPSAGPPAANPNSSSSSSSGTPTGDAGASSSSGSSTSSSGGSSSSSGGPADGGGGDAS